MRLDKFLANSGIGTRKEVKEIIKKKKISVNGVFVKDGKIHIDENKDVIKYENKVVGDKPFVYIMMNKPKGVVSATEDNDVKTLENGIKLEENFVTKKAKVEVISENLHENGDNQVYITISEGKFHQVKRMFKAVNNEVLYLKRVKMGNLSLDENLKLGEYRELTEEELDGLKF